MAHRSQLRKLSLELLERRNLFAIEVFPVKSAATQGPETLDDALNSAWIYTQAQDNRAVVKFDLAWAADGHKYYQDDGKAGVSATSIHPVSETGPSTCALVDDKPDVSLCDQSLLNADPDWPHSWWSIKSPSNGFAEMRRTELNGYLQAGSKENSSTSILNNNSVLRIEVDGSDLTGLRIFDPHIDATIRGLVINGADHRNAQWNIGVGIMGNSGGPPGGGRNHVGGNYVGTDISGTRAVGNDLGITFQLSSNNVIGVDTTSVSYNPTVPYLDQNIISGQARTGFAFVYYSYLNTVQGNLVGVGRDGLQPIPNGGVGGGFLSLDNNNSASYNNVTDNVIAHNGSAGMSVMRIGAKFNRIWNNSIYANGGLGIDLGGDWTGGDGRGGGNELVPGPNGVNPGDTGIGPNDFQAYPILESVVNSSCGIIISGTLQSTANHRFTIHFYSVTNPDPSGHGEGDTYLGEWQVLTDGTGLGKFVAVIPGASPLHVSATATDIAGSYNGFVYGNTSEFSVTAESTASSCNTPPGATPAGVNVEVTPIDKNTGVSNVTLSFAQITSGGETAVTSFDNGTPPPANFLITNPPQYYDIHTTALFNGSVEVCVTYDESAVGNESNLHFFHLENGIWMDRTSSLDTQANVICANVTSFSPFAIFEATQLVSMKIDLGQDVNNQKVNLQSNGLISVVLFTTSLFDARFAIVSSIRLQDAKVNSSRLMDFDRDGDLDLVMTFRIQEIGMLNKYRDLLREDLADGKLDSNVKTERLRLTGASLNGLFQAFGELDVFLSGKPLEDILDEIRRSRR